jgi:hypothetical protein
MAQKVVCFHVGYRDGGVSGLIRPLLILLGSQVAQERVKMGFPARGHEEIGKFG